MKIELNMAPAEPGGRPRIVGTVHMDERPLPGESFANGDRVYQVIQRAIKCQDGQETLYGLLVQQVGGPPHLALAGAGDAAKLGIRLG